MQPYKQIMHAVTIFIVSSDSAYFTKISEFRDDTKHFTQKDDAVKLLMHSCKIYLIYDGHY